jgi:lipopolysaccharide heptosyltransferase II
VTKSPRHRLRLALLRAFGYLTSPFQSANYTTSQTSSSDTPRILVIRPDHMGDLLFTTPALRTLRQRLPEAHITALVGAWGASVLTNNPSVDQCITLPFPGFTKTHKSSLWQPYALLYRWAHHLKGQYDMAFVLRFDHWWGALLAYQARIPQRIGYALPELVPFLNHAASYTAGRHEVEQNLHLVSLGTEDRDHNHASMPTITPAGYPLEFHIPEKTHAWALDALAGDDLIAIHPGAGADIKLWHTDGWAAVADRLAQITGCHIVLTGSEAERTLCMSIDAHMTAAASVLAGATTLDQLAAVLARCQLVLGVDSGPLHLAVAVGTPTVHLYGPVDQRAFGPWGRAEQHRVLTSHWPCIPCNRLDYDADEAPQHPCIKEISADHVIATALQVLRF